MNCKQIESRVMDYLDGNLAAPERQALEAHAQSCSSCAERIRGFTDVFCLLDSWKGMEPSPSFNARLQQRLEEQPAASDWFGSLLGRLIPLPAANPVFAVALLVVVSVAAIVVRYSPTRPQTLASQQQSAMVTVAAGVDDLALYRNLPVLEDLDVLRNFDVLQELNSNR